MSYIPQAFRNITTRVHNRLDPLADAIVATVRQAIVAAGLPPMPPYPDTGRLGFSGRLDGVCNWPS